MTSKNPPTPRILALLLAAFLISLPAQAQYGGGTGEPNDPWLIYTPEQMNAIGADPNHWDKHFKLMADIDLSEYRGTSFNLIGHEWRAIITDRGRRASFTGVFDGNGHTISRFARRSATARGIGLFEYVGGPDAEIRNLGLIDPNVIAEENELSSSYAGVLVGCLAGGTLTNCYVRGGSISGVLNVGGLVGYNSGGTIINSHTMTDVSGESSVGGLVGASGIRSGSKSVPGAAIIGCHATGRVTGGGLVGGLAGNNQGTVNDCYSTGAVCGTGTVGGLVGLNEKTISKCHAAGNVSGTYFVGGLVGFNDIYGTITDCGSTGTTDGQRHTGGLVGYNRSTVADCRSTSAVAGDFFIGGLVGRNDGTITNSHTTGSVTGDSSIGGLIGESFGKITGCYSTGGVCGIQRVGGLVGSSDAEIRDCYSTSVVYATEFVGGLAGENGRTITNCYSTGMVWGTQDVGSFVGINDGAITNCYAVGLTVGSERMGGLVGSARASYYPTATVTGSFWDIQTTRQLTSAGGTGKSTFKMQAADTFLSAGWDFVGETVNGTEDIWWIDEGKDYPRLWWEAAAIDDR